MGFGLKSTQATRGDRISHKQAVGLIESFLRFPVQETTTALMLAALRTRERFGLSYWDAAIIEAAWSMGSTTLLSEGLGHHVDYDGVRVEDPFRGEQ